CPCRLYCNRSGYDDNDCTNGPADASGPREAGGVRKPPDRYLSRGIRPATARCPCRRARSSLPRSGYRKAAMIQERVIAALDIGSAKTTVVIAEAVGESHRQPTLKILGVGQARTTGLRRGIVSDIEETTRSIKKAVEDAERMAGTKIDSIYAGIAGEHVRAMISKGIVAMNGEEISKADVSRANEVARAQPIPQDRELLHAI